MYLFAEDLSDRPSIQTNANSLLMQLMMLMIMKVMEIVDIATDSNADPFSISITIPTM